MRFAWWVGSVCCLAWSWRGSMLWWVGTPGVGRLRSLPVSAARLLWALGLSLSALLPPCALVSEILTPLGSEQSLTWVRSEPSVMGSSVWWTPVGTTRADLRKSLLTVLMFSLCFFSIGISYLMLLKQCLVSRRRQTGLWSGSKTENPLLVCSFWKTCFCCTCHKLILW